MNPTNIMTPTRAAVPRVASAPSALTRVVFLDNVRYLMVLLVVVYHSVAAYSAVAPHWYTHDTSFFAADIVRELFDVFLMPVMFFVAGYFALPSLEKKGVWEFLKDKAKRLLIPWALAVLIVTPLAVYDQPNKPITPFWNYWLHYVGNLEIRLNFPQYGPQYQNVYWFISLLFAFFIVFALVYTVTRGGRSRAGLAVGRKVTNDKPVFGTLMLFGVLTSVGYFVSLLLCPDATWFRLGLLLEFQAPRLVLFAGYLAFGVYAQSHKWFTDGKPLGSIALWGTASVALTAAYLAFVQPLVANPAGTLGLPVGLLLAFAFVRSFMLLSLLVVFVSFGVRYWNRSNGLDRQLAATSYNIYLTHVWFVVILQEALTTWAGGPTLAKFAIVLLAALALSYAISRWVIGRFPRAFVMIILALFAFCLVFRP